MTKKHVIVLYIEILNMEKLNKKIGINTNLKPNKYKPKT